MYHAFREFPSQILIVFGSTKILAHALRERDAKEPYLKHLTNVHQNLPVAGFETNVRVPIPLEKVFVKLCARMTELEHIRRGGGNLTAARNNTVGPDVNVEDVLQFALDNQYDGVVNLGNPGSGKLLLRSISPSVL